jgi:hypothetical protein
MRAARDRSRCSSRNLSGDKVRPVPITTETARTRPNVTRLSARQTGQPSGTQTIDG